MTAAPMTLAEITESMESVIREFDAGHERIEKARAAHAEAEQKHAANMREIHDCIKWMRGRSK